MKRCRRGDRLSALPDETLERILSHLPSNQAVRTSTLSRRWRDVYAGVPVVNLADPKSGRRCKEIRGVCFDQQVTGAILCKGPGTPIRTFRLKALSPPRDLLDQWIVSAVSSGVEEVDVKLRYWHSSSRRLCPFGSSKEASADFDACDRNLYVKTQHHLFGCATLCTLRLTNWTLDLPGSLSMASLNTLCLTRIMDPGGLLQQLLSNCPRLTNLTLQECPSLTKITVTSAHLRSFTMICCHHATRIKLRSPCLQSLHYQGGLPPKSLFRLANHAGVTALTVEICEDLTGKEPAEFAPATKLIKRCTKLAYLHLYFRPSMAYYSSLFTDAVPCLKHLRQLDLDCCLLNDHDIRSVAVLLCHTHNLEVLTLFPLGSETTKEVYSLYWSDSKSDTESLCNGESETESSSDSESDTELLSNIESDTGHEKNDDDGVDYSSWPMHIGCLDDKLRRINIEIYRGLQLEKILAKFLLSKAAALEEFSVTLTDGCSQKERRIKKEPRSWRSNHHTRITIERWY